ncbi:hypothetical protein GZ212_15720 [Mangrovimonas sp. CR14]|uniref:hypothetical protein n=1 Tax=Mangrovimonas sp. CR14 TaxID=2706120 RepID=UPI0014246321|nr:hypothetical protein [Mangrovimonas sp. CR14]NIK93609.1 hypothetical protein [Mangrovimonas sp. CR14]
MRKRISTNTRNWRFAPIIIGIIMLGIVIKILTENKNDLLAIGILTFFIFMLTGLYFVFDRAKSIEFDNQHLFILSKNLDEKIPFKNIKKIKKTLAEINDRDIWKIYYRDKNNIEKSIRVWPRWNSKYFEEFKSVALENNNEIVIKK